MVAVEGRSGSYAHRCRNAIAMRVPVVGTTCWQLIRYGYSCGSPVLAATIGVGHP